MTTDEFWTCKECKIVLAALIGLLLAFIANSIGTRQELNEEMQIKKVGPPSK